MNASVLSERTVLLAGKYSQQFRAPVAERLGPGWTITSWEPADGELDLQAKSAVAEIIVGAPDWALEAKGASARASFAAAQRLRLVVVAFSGTDWIVPAWLPAGCVVCNVNSGIDPIAEYVLCAMLHMEIPLQQMDAELRQQSWTWGGGTVMGRKHGELQDKTLGLVGFGRIGQRVAQLATAFRMKTRAVSRRPGTSPHLGQWGGMDALPQLLRESDYVLVSVPGGTETVDLLGAEQLALMKRSAVLINVARGSVINEKALFETLAERRIRGAVIDTWYTYPTQRNPVGPPSRFSFETLDNVVMTPHAAGWTDALELRRGQAIADHVSRYIAGETMTDVVFDTRSPSAAAAA